MPDLDLLRPLDSNTTSESVSDSDSVVALWVTEIGMRLNFQLSYKQ